MSPDELVHLQLHTHGCRAELSLNGFPLALCVPEGPRGMSVPCHEFLVPGENELVLVVEPGSRPSTALTEQRELARAGAWALARLIRFPEGVEPAPEYGTTLLEFRWEAHPSQPETFPVVERGRADLGALFGRWAWQDAPPLVLDDALVTEARAVLEAVGRALGRGALAEYTRLVSQQSADAQRAYPAYTQAVVEATLAASVAHYERSKGGFFPLDGARHDFRLVVGGRVLECVDADYLPSLKLMDPGCGAPVPYGLFLARIDGELRVVR